MKHLKYTILFVGLFALVACNPPAPPKKNSITEKHNYIVLLDLSDRIVVQDNQVDRDIEIIEHIYGLFENKIKKSLYVRSRDELKVVIAPQKGSRLQSHKYEDKLFINIENIKLVERNKKEAERKEAFTATIRELYKKAKFSKDPKAYHGADIWKYFYEDLQDDYSKDTLTKNYLFILTDGYPIVGKKMSKLQPIKNKFPDLNVILVEAAPRSEDMEWDRIINTWEVWFKEIGVDDYTLIKRKAISKEKEILTDMVLGK